MSSLSIATVASCWARDGAAEVSTLAATRVKENRIRLRFMISLPVARELAARCLAQAYTKPGLRREHVTRAISSCLVPPACVAATQMGCIRLLLFGRLG